MRTSDRKQSLKSSDVHWRPITAESIRATIGGNYILSFNDSFYYPKRYLNY